MKKYGKVPPQFNNSRHSQPVAAGTPLRGAHALNVMHHYRSSKMGLITKKIIFVSILILNGCMSPIVDPTSLKSTSIDECVQVKSITSYSVGSSSLGLAPRYYRAELEDERGTYYVGVGRPVWQKVDPDSKFRVRKGGIWIPKADESATRLYTYYEKEVFEVDEINPNQSPTAENVDSLKEIG